MRVETRYVDDDGGIPRVHIILNGQNCGPSLPCSREWFEKNQARFELLVKELAHISESTGAANTKRAIRTAIGV